MVLKSIKVFLLLNSIVVTVGYLSYKVHAMMPLATILTDIAIKFFYVLVLELGVDKPRIKGSTPSPVRTSDFLLYTTVNGAITGATNILFMSWYIGTQSETASLQIDFFFYFVAKSFLYELIFDMAHCYMHKMLHESPSLYCLHRKHHQYVHNSVRCSFIMDPRDVLLTHIIPTLVCTTLLHRVISPFEYCLIRSYMVYQEAGGHLGKHTYPTAGFTQFVWLPRALDIQMTTEAHDLHHTGFNCNYSKRFTVWDKFLGTYRQPDLIQASREKVT